jgi:hypothetical protein
VHWSRLDILCLLAASAFPAEAARVIAAGRISADARDSEGETLGGIGSAIETTPDGVVMLSDRGPGDGTMDYRPRLQFFRVTREGGKLGFKPERALVLRDSNGRAFTGLFPDLPQDQPPQRRDERMCLDPEGLAIGLKGSFFISEEYMPSVREFDAQGRFVRRFETPDEVVPRGASGADVATDEADALTSGRQPNRGFEGLAILPDGRLAAVLQSGLTQDGGRKAGFTRLYLFDPARGRATGSYRVDFPDAAELDAAAPPGKTLEAKHLVISALAALPDGRLLALERENFGSDGSGKHGPARWKAVVLLDLAGAGNILEGGSTPVRRTVLFNLAALDTASSGLPREELPAKWEGLAVAGIEGDRLRLLLSSDNDFLTPRLHLRDESGSAREVEFPRAERAQDTWILEVETTLPPVTHSTPRNT